MTPHPQRCETLKTLYDYCVEQFTSAEDNSDVETAFEKMLVLFPQTHYNRTGIWNGCAFPATTEQEIREKVLDKFYQFLDNSNKKRFALWELKQEIQNLRQGEQG